MRGHRRNINPFFWLGLKRLSRHRDHQYTPSWRYRANPFNWSKRTVRIFTASFFLIMLPIYLYIGLQPVSSIEALGYPELTIPSIDLKTPVASLELKEHQLIAPDTIAGAYSQYLGKTLIIGHSSTVFRTLSAVSLGDTIEYDEYNYIVTDYQVLAKADIDMYEILSASSKETLIIMTCAGESLPNQDATHRLIITAVLSN